MHTLYPIIKVSYRDMATKEDYRITVRVLEKLDEDIDYIATVDEQQAMLSVLEDQRQKIISVKHLATLKRQIISDLHLW